MSDKKVLTLEDGKRKVIEVNSIIDSILMGYGACGSCSDLEILHDDEGNLLTEGC